MQWQRRGVQPGGGVIAIRCEKRCAGRFEMVLENVLAGYYIVIEAAACGWGWPTRVHDTRGDAIQTGAGTLLGYSCVQIDRDKLDESL